MAAAVVAIVANVRWFPVNFRYLTLLKKVILDAALTLLFNFVIRFGRDFRFLALGDIK